jgi:hypothetical protein
MVKSRKRIFVDLIFGLLIGKVVVALQDQNLEHQYVSIFSFGYFK